MRWTDDFEVEISARAHQSDVERMASRFEEVVTVDPIPQLPPAEETTNAPAAVEIPDNDDDYDTDE